MYAFLHALSPIFNLTMAPLDSVSSTQHALYCMDVTQGISGQVDPLGDLNTEAERRLGALVKAKYHTDFYILYRYPLAVSMHVQPFHHGKVCSWV